MASLTKQAIALQIKGLDTRTANALRVPGALEKAENVYMDKAGELRKRSGSASLPTNNAPAVSGAGRLMALGEQLLIEGAVKTGERSPTGSTWVDHASEFPFTIDVAQLSDGGASISNPDVVYNNGYIIAAWLQSNSVYYTVVEEGSRTVIVAPSIAVTSGTCVHLVNVGTNTIVFAFLSGTGVVARNIDLSSFTGARTLSTQTTVYASAVVGSASNWDAAPHSATHAKVCARSTTNLSAQFWTPAGVASGNQVSVITSAGVASQGAVGWMENYSGNGGHYVAVNITTAIREVRLGTTFILVSDNLVNTATYASLAQPTGYTSGFSPTIYCRTNTGGTTRTYPASRPFVPPGGSNDIYMLFYYHDVSNATSTEGTPTISPQPCYLLFNLTDSTTIPVATILLGHAPVVPCTFLGNAGVSSASSRYILPALRRTRVGLTVTSFQRAVSQMAGSLAALGIELNFAPGNELGPPAEHGGTLFIPGGAPKIFDGASLRRFQSLTPEKPVVPSGAATAFAFQYCSTLEWSDAAGNLHRSAPSLPSTYYGASATSYATSLAGVATPTTDRTLTTAMWRTKVNGSEFQRISGASPDATSDATLASQEFLYTTGGVIENMAPPPCKVACTHGGRVWVASSEFTSELWYSKEYEVNQVLEFSGYFAMDIGSPSEGGITALASLDDKLIIFKKNAIYYLSGEGPDNTGNGEFTPTVKLPTALGTERPRSVVSTPDGVFFQDTTGQIWAISRGLELTYIGAGVKDYEAQEVTGAVYVGTHNQVRLTCSSGSMLVYDRINSQWFTWTGMGSSIAAAMVNGVHHWMSSTGVVSYETPGVYADGASQIVSTIKTAPIALSGLQGYARLYDVLLLGERRAAHVMTVKLYYDYATTEGDYQYLSPGAGAFMIECRPSRQKCSAVQVEILDTPAGNIDGFSLQGITLNVGAKGRLYAPSAKSTPV